MIRLVAIDLDGTLLTRSKLVCAKAAKVLIELPGRGIQVIIASARPPRSVRHTYNSLGLTTWQINYNGALIWDETSCSVVQHFPLDGARVREIIDRARERFEHVVVTCEILDRWYTDRAEQSHTTETGRLFKPDVIAPLDTFCNRPITKLMLLGEPSIIKSLHADLLNRTDITLIHSDPDLLKITHPQASKATALEYIAAHYQVPLTQVLAIGDAANDISMLRIAGVAVAMDNADQTVKEVADWVAPSNDDHGVHEALIRYGLT